ncbi:MAG: carboxypeptidase-like regulatory domain-containing protein [Planctomycetaceae bacterium]|nr:carboxypeptidase-like regulatory domain-containing protein [Planctomycetaceae bacterium]
MNQFTQLSSRYKSLLLGFLVVFLVSVPILVSFFSNPETKTLSQSITEKLTAIAVNPNLPKVAVQGKVILPDGTLVPFCLIDILSVNYMPNPDGNSFHIASDGISDSTKNDGSFQIDNAALPGSNVVVTVSGRGEYKRFVSEPIVFVAHDKMEPLTIILNEGIPIRSRLTYEDSTPAAGRSVYIEREIEPLIGADLPNIREAFRRRWYCPSNKNGEYELYVAPGDYTIHWLREEQKISVAKNDEPKEFNRVLPTPITIEVVAEKGAELERSEYAYTFNDGTVAGYLGSDGIVVIDPIYKESDFFLLTADKKFGISETLTLAMNGKKIQTVLKPSVQVVLTVLDKKNKPLKNANVSVSSAMRGGSYQYYLCNWDSVKTDASGKATLHIPPGKLNVVINLPGSYVIPIPAGGRAYHETIEKKVNTAPGEVIDFGTVILEKR